MGPDDTFILPIELAFLDGTERITPNLAVIDFWAWALGDLRLNSTRGLFAQFLVAKAVGDTSRFDDGWGSYDVITDTGVKIEVKTSAYLQSWRQRRLSNISFSGLITRGWTPDSGYAEEPEVVADLYVFCVQTCKEPAKYDPLDVKQWDFYVISGPAIAERNQKSMGINTVRELSGGPVSWQELGDQVHDLSPE